MTRPNRPEDEGARLAAIERRLKALEVGGRAEHTTIQGGLFRVRDVAGDLRAGLGDLDDDGTSWGLEVTQGGVIRVKDADGNLRALLGELDDDGNFGVEIYDAAGGRRFAAHDDGMKDPYQSWQVAQAQSRVSVDDTMVGGIGTHTCLVHLVSHLGVIVRVSALIDPGCTGEVWLLNDDTTEETAHYPIADGFGDVTFKWLHGSPLGTTVVPFQVRAEITSGTGVMEVFDPPGGLIMADPAVCTATGLP